MGIRESFAQKYRIETQLQLRSSGIKLTFSEVTKSLPGLQVSREQTLAADCEATELW